MLLNFLTDKTYIQITIFYCFFGLFFLYGMFYLVRRVFPHFVVPDHDADFMAALHAGLFTITFLTLGYSLSNVSDTADKYQKDVIVEANELKTLDLLLTLYDAQESTEMRQDLRKYAKSIVIDEWPLLTKGQGSEKTLALQRTMRADLQLFKPLSGKELTIYSQLLETVGKIVHARSTRIQDSDTRLAPQFLITNNVGYIGVLLISALMLTQFSWFRFIALTIQVVAVSFLFGATIVLDDPFRGTEKISPEPIHIIAESPLITF